MAATLRLWRSSLSVDMIAIVIITLLRSADTLFTRQRVRNLVNDHIGANIAHNQVSTHETVFHIFAQSR